MLVRFPGKGSATKVRNRAKTLAIVIPMLTLLRELFIGRRGFTGKGGLKLWMCSIRARHLRTRPLVQCSKHGSFRKNVLGFIMPDQRWTLFPLQPDRVKNYGSIKLYVLSQHFRIESILCWEKAIVRVLLWLRRKVLKHKRSQALTKEGPYLPSLLPHSM